MRGAQRILLTAFLSLLIAAGVLYAQGIGPPQGNSNHFRTIDLTGAATVAAPTTAATGHAAIFFDTTKGKLQQSISTAAWADFGGSGTVAVTGGGTGLTSVTAGDILYASASNTLSRLPKGSDTQVLTLASGIPSWATPSGGSLPRWVEPRAYTVPILCDSFGLAFANSATVTVGNRPRGIAFDGTSLWVAIGNGMSVAKVNAATHAISATVTTSDDPVAVCVGNGFVWVAEQGSKVDKINPTTNAIVATITVGAGVSITCTDGIAYGNGFVWVVNKSGNTVSKINATTNAVAATITVGAAPISLTYDGVFVWVLNQNDTSLTKINASTNAIVDPALSVGADPQGITFDGSFIWVSDPFSSLIYAVDPVAMTVIGSAYGGNGAAIKFDGLYLWTAQPLKCLPTPNNSNSVTYTASSFTAGGGATGLAFDGAYMWVTNNTDGTIQSFAAR